VQHPERLRLLCTLHKRPW